MKILLLSLFLCLGLVSNAQHGIFGFQSPADKKQFYTVCALQFISGLSRGYEQVVVYHYDKFKAKHPHAKDQYFNPAISWTNKYKNNDPAQGPKFPLSTTALVWTTDFKHLMDATSDVSTYASVVIPLTSEHKKVKFKYIATRAIAIIGARALGFNLIYQAIYK